MIPVKVTILATVLASAAALSGQTNATSSPATISETTIGTGFDYSRGGYGFAIDTEVFSVPLNIGYERGSWRLNANLSYLTIKGPATVVGGSGTLRPTASSESGFGDIYLGATYHFGPVAGQLNLDATARVKLATAAEDRGLGTGANDYYGELTAFETFGNVTPFATVGYRTLGDTALYQLSNGAYVTGGAHFRVSPRSVISTLINWRQPIVQGGDRSVDATVMFTHDVNANWRLVAYVLKGFTDGSPDLGTGLQLNYHF